MIHGLGIDITELARIDRARTSNPHFAQRVLTPAEFAAYSKLEGQHALEFLGGRFSVKESYSKAYGTGLGTIALQDVETLNDANGKPEITAHPYTGRAHVSISHTAALVMTEVILEENA